KSEEVAELIRSTVRPEMFAAAYEHVFEGDHRWAAIATPESSVFEWDEESTYLRRPPYLDGVTLEPRLVRDIRGGRALAVLGEQ
ncbi:hypothetical protein, partial [Rubellimicrobium arenae]|uniref:hypothetical protein n=1 Tax=Rubellimicrobium arenae TaxID=2817372 RepID=UPI001B30F20A